MSQVCCRPLLEALSEVPDFRKSQGRRHSLAAILALICAATLCGYQSYGAMAEWGQHYGRDLVARLGFKDGKPASVGTLHTVLSRLDKQAFERVLASWAESVLACLPEAATLQGVALDGKTLRGSAAAGASEAHLLSAVSHGLGLTLAQVAVAEKTNEIGAVSELLGALVLEGRVLTMDALLTQKRLACQIVAKGGST